MSGDKPITSEELNELERIIDAMTPIFRTWGFTEDNSSARLMGKNGEHLATFYDVKYQGPANLDGIVALRNNAHRLIEAARRVDKVCSCGIQTGQNAGYRFCPWCGRKRK